jgi:predicted DNA-binding ribbon-helix-helix protein
MLSNNLETAKPLLADAYFDFLKYLKKEQKIQVVYELVREIADYPSEQDNSICSIDKFCGAWKSEKDAEKIVSEIRNSRFFNRETEVF